MIPYLLMILAFGGAMAFGYKYIKDEGRKDCELAQMQKQARIEELQKQVQANLNLATDEANRGQDAIKAKGTENDKLRRTIAQQVVAKGAEDVAANRVPTDVKCTLPDDVLRNYNAARAGPMRRVGANTSGVGGLQRVPGVADAAGRTNDHDVPAGNSGRESILGVQGQSGSDSHAPQVSGGVVQTSPRPKPKPIGRDK